MTVDNAAPRQRGRPFRKGQSGNPKGMPSGSRHKATLILDKIGAEAGTSVLQAVLRAAEQGDMTAARIVLDRAWPVRKGRSVRFALPPLESLADVSRATAAIAAAVAAGELTSDEAAGLASVLAAHVRAAEAGDLEARVVALEASQQRGSDRP